MGDVVKVSSADGTSIAVEPSGAGPALILVDPASGFRGFGPMEPLAPLLAEAFTVFRYDRRGRGDSGDTQPYSVSREIDDLRAVIERAGGSASVFGYSSGATLALHAAARGVPIDRLVLFEPPVLFGDEPPEEDDLGAEVAELVAAGRRAEAVEHFNRACGVPEDMIAGLAVLPVWPALQAAAHTLVYDAQVTSQIPNFAAVTIPVLVLDSSGSTDDLQGWARRLVEALPNARHRSLTGGWHGAAPEDVVTAIREFLAERR